jgi:hypothetical protein
MSDYRDVLRTRVTAQMAEKQLQIIVQNEGVGTLIHGPALPKADAPLTQTVAQPTTSTNP